MVNRGVKIAINDYMKPIEIIYAILLTAIAVSVFSMAEEIIHYCQTH